MNEPFKVGLVAALIAAASLVTLGESALANKAPPVRKQTPAAWYRSGDDVRCVDRSF
jgi:hypothetical protein